MKKVFILSLTLALILAGCSLIKAPLTKTTTLEGDEQQQVLDYATPKADNLISGLVTGDYSVFSADFSQTMKTGMDQAAFDELLQTFSSKLGTYRTHEVNVVLKNDDYTTVAYKMIFEKDDAVVMRIVFDNQEPHLISGLWFDSPELRK